MARPAATDPRPGTPALTAEGATPAIAQWFAAKAEHPDALVFFRMGDFYELFFDDAARAAAALDIQLTQRGTHAGRPIDMCGVPVHAADAYLARLIREGFRVAVAEQMEDPRTRAKGAKQPLHRAVVRLVTPGTLTEEVLLDPARDNLLLALAQGGDGGCQVGAAWLDMSTGRFETEELPAAGLSSLLGRIDPVEILAHPAVPLGEWADRRAPDDISLSPAAARAALGAYAGTALDGLGVFSDLEVIAAARALAYVRLTQAGRLPNLGMPRPSGRAGHLQMDGATRASLEILRGRDGGAGLLGCIRRTLTAPGARLLAERLGAPVTDAAAIVLRQDSWSWLLLAPAVLGAIRAALKATPDMARALARLSVDRATPRDLAALRDGQAAALAIAEAMAGAELPRELRQLRRALDLDPAFFVVLRDALAVPAPARLEDGGTIARGFDGELDALRALRDDSRSALGKLQLDLAQRYGVASLKIRHHQQIGYVMEVPAAAVERLRGFPDLSLRQSMANGARFTGAELSELDRRITEAAGEAASRERGIFQHLTRRALAFAAELAEAATALAAIDVAQSCAKLAETGRWCRPAVGDGLEFCIEAGRHPVVEAAVTGSTSFIANDCDLSPSRRLLLLTGPNMAGKSTYLRQTALIVLLAQAGLPVPAAAARLGIVDRLFCRVGAADDLARGRSTFMVEMIETAAILNQAGPASLVLIDEIGRGTATLDGLAIAWAVLESLHNQARSRAIFATHFHELARLRHELPHLCPHTMRVKEWRGDVVFLHEIAEGAAGRSWGVQVAKLAGVPAPVVRRAGVILAALETRGAGLTQDVELPLFANAKNETPEHSGNDRVDAIQEHAQHDRRQSVWQAVSKLEPDRLTPKQALDLLYGLAALRDGAVQDTVGAPEETM